jgi:polysaccharide export outer membrane protein
MKLFASLFITSCLIAPCLPAQTESLLIGPGDEVKVQVYDTPELDEIARVTDRGELPLLFGGTVRVASLPPSGAAHVIEKALIENHILKQPRVLVTVLQFATQSVTVFGQVATPGAYTISTPRSILDVLSLAGGLTEQADRHVTIERRDGSKQETLFVANESAAAIHQNLLVYPGDRIVVPKSGVVYILGDVGRPGGYPMTNNDSQLTVLQTVALAGGTPTSAVPSQAKLIRRTSSGKLDQVTISISAMQKGKLPDMILQAGDIIYVPFSYLRNNASLGAAGIVSSAASALIYAH